MTTTITRPWAPGDPLPSTAEILGGIDPAVVGHAAGDGARAGVTPPYPARAPSDYQRGLADGRQRLHRSLRPLLLTAIRQHRSCRHLAALTHSEDPTRRTYDALADAYRGEWLRLRAVRRSLLEDLNR